MPERTGPRSHGTPSSRPEKVSTTHRVRRPGADPGQLPGHLSRTRRARLSQRRERSGADEREERHGARGRCDDPPSATTTEPHRRVAATSARRDGRTPARSEAAPSSESNEIAPIGGRMGGSIPAPSSFEEARPAAADRAAPTADAPGIRHKPEVRTCVVSADGNGPKRAGEHSGRCHPTGRQRTGSATLTHASSLPARWSKWNRRVAGRNRERLPDTRTRASHCDRSVLQTRSIRPRPDLPAHRGASMVS